MIDFECNMSENYGKEESIDEWGCAYFWWNDNIGVEYNYCIYGDDNSSAIYKMKYQKGEDYWKTDHDCYVHYEVDFNDADWKDRLESAMANAVREMWNMKSLAEIKKQITEFKEKYGWVRNLEDLKEINYNDVIEINGTPYIKGDVIYDEIRWIRFENYKDLHYIYIYVKENDIRFDVFDYDEDDFWLDYVSEDTIDTMWKVMSRYEAV